MGEMKETRCRKCGYTAEISGGIDSGFSVTVQTKICLDCRAFVDVILENRGEFGPPDLELNVCPDCGGGNLEPWTGESPCPKCGGEMEDGGIIMLWD